jgi:hypothetical protein
MSRAYERRGLTHWDMQRARYRRQMPAEREARVNAICSFLPEARDAYIAALYLRHRRFYGSTALNAYRSACGAWRAREACRRSEAWEEQRRVARSA